MNDESDQEFGQEKPPGSNAAVWMTIGFWVLFLVFGTIGAQKWLEERQKADPARIIAAEAGNGPGIAIDGGRWGHYRVQGLVNGQVVDFLVDTGATEVSIPESVAERIGLIRGEPGFAETANGIATIYDTQIDTLEIGPLKRRNVAAHISPGLSAGHEALLGMSFLRHFTLVQAGDQLQIQTP